MVATHAQEPARPADAAQQPARPADATQQPTRPADPAQPATRTDASAKSIVVTGCVTGGPAAFTLTNAMAANATGKPGEAVGTSGISSSYDLSARAGVDLAPHVGHKVEITGTPAEASAAPGAGAAGSPAATSPAAGSPAAGKTPAAKLTVTAVKMVSASCS
jgi:hypothetical protein